MRLQCQKCGAVVSVPAAEIQKRGWVPDDETLAAFLDRCATRGEGLSCPLCGLDGPEVYHLGVAPPEPRAAKCQVCGRADGGHHAGFRCAGPS